MRSVTGSNKHPEKLEIGTRPNPSHLPCRFAICLELCARDHYRRRLLMRGIRNMGGPSIPRRFAALAGLHLFLLYHCCHGMPIDQIIANALEQRYSQGVLYHETGQAVRVEMDMIFSLEDWRRLLAQNRSMDGRGGLHKRQAIWEGQFGARYWPGGVINYQIDPQTFDTSEIRTLHEAMNEWMRYTCIEFRPVRWNTTDDRNILRFVDGRECSSNLGMTKDGTNVTLGRGCRTKTVVLHELGHALGFHHEQSRPDRDQFVRIHHQNVTVPHFNFRKYTWAVIRNLGVVYDYLSIMHYSKSAGSHDGKLTIETLDKKYQDVIGNRDMLSFRDIKSANILYNCKPERADCGLKDEDCPGEGFVGKDCACWCPTQDLNRDIPYYICQSEDTRDRECQDRQPTFCKLFASRGKCQTTKKYMQEYCPRACGFCNEAVTSECRDDYDECGFWRSKGFCRQRSHFRNFMAAYCQLSCGICSPPQGPDSKVFPCERNCRNDDKECDLWAWRGECRTTPDYMHRHCRKACKLCCTANNLRRGVRASPPPPRPARRRHASDRP